MLICDKHNVEWHYAVVPRFTSFTTNYERLYTSLLYKV